MDNLKSSIYMARLPKRLEEIRKPLIIDLFETGETAADIGKIFDLTTSQVYNILKEHKVKERE